MKVSTLISFLAAAVTVSNADSFSAEDQAIWIDRHNYFRTTGLPWSAGNMRRIGWDVDLAATAATTAAKCSATTSAGVNVFLSSSSNSSDILDESIQSWVVETSVKILKTLTQPGASGVDVGTGVYNSYSQVLWSSTTSVGCASASCSGGDMVVCEYSPAGNDGSSAWYVHAETASDCPSGTTASQGLCIVEGDAANDQIAAIPAGEWTYEVYPTYVTDIQTVLIEAARAIANGSSGPSTGSNTTATTAPTSATTTPTATTATPTSTKKPTATTATPSSKDSSTPSTSNSKKTTTSSSSDKGEDSSTATKKSKTTSSESSADSSKSTKQETSLSGDSSSPGKVKASSDSGSTFTNQATQSAESSTSQTSTISGSTATASAPSTDATTTESTTSSTTTKTSGSSASISANNQSSTSSDGGISATGMAGMIVLGIVGVAAFGVVMSYRRNQERQREIMRDGGIRII